MNKSSNSSHFDSENILSEKGLKSESDAKLIFTLPLQHDEREA
jgi:hypothetical protein